MLDNPMVYGSGPGYEDPETHYDHECPVCGAEMQEDEECCEQEED